MLHHFSVLISIYFKENPNFLREALDSVFAQTLQPTEIVLVKDGPLTPELDAVLDEYIVKYPIFKIIVNETNLGLGLAMAKGVEACTNEYIVRMDTDDIIPPTRFDKEIEKLSEGYDVVSCWSLLFEGSLDNVIAIKERPETTDEILRLAKRRSPMCHAGSAFRKSAVLSAGNYLHAQYYEDYYLWVRMLNMGAKFYNIQEVLYFVRIYSSSIGRRGGWRYMVNEERLFAKFYKLGFYSLWDLIRNTMTQRSGKGITCQYKKLFNSAKRGIIAKVKNYDATQYNILNLLRFLGFNYSERKYGQVIFVAGK